MVAGARKIPAQPSSSALASSPCCRCPEVDEVVPSADSVTTSRDREAQCAQDPRTQHCSRGPLRRSAAFLWLFESSAASLSCRGSGSDQAFRTPWRHPFPLQIASTGAPRCLNSRQSLPQAVQDVATATWAPCSRRARRLRRSPRFRSRLPPSSSFLSHRCRASGESPCSWLPRCFHPWPQSESARVPDIVHWHPKKPRGIERAQNLKVWLPSSADH